MAGKTIQKAGAASARSASSGSRAAAAASFSGAGTARLGKRTKALVATLAPRAIVILDHPDLDAVAAQALIPRRPLAVINNQPFVTGRYPNRGPGLLIDAGVPVFDLCPGGEDDEDDALADAPSRPDLFALLTDGEAVRIEGERLLRADGTPVAALRALSPERLKDRLAAARANLDTELSAFAQNTLRYLDRAEERSLLLDPVSVPDVRAAIAGRHVLVAVRGEGYEEDLRLLGPYLREQSPVVIAVDGAADTLIASGIKPQIILGDMDSISDDALRCGAQIIVHAYARPREGETINAPGMARVQALGLSAITFPVAGTSEDAALLLAHEKGADLIVAVGTHTNLEDFLDKGRGGMASTFLVRLKVGSRLVDARGVSRLYTGREKVGPLLLFLLLAALFPIFVLLSSTPQGQVAWRSIVVWFRLYLG